MLSFSKKKEAIERAQAGHSIAKIARSLDVSRGSIYSWVKAHESKGDFGLLPKNTSPHHKPKSLTAEEIDKILNFALDYPRENIRALKKILSSAGDDYSISTIHKYLKKPNLVGTQERISRLLLYNEVDYLSETRKQQLKLLCPRFADADKLATRPGSKFLVSLKKMAVGGKNKSELPVWFFVDLYRLFVTAIVDDSYSLSDIQKTQLEAWIPTAAHKDNWGTELVVPVTTWMNVFGGSSSVSPIQLVFMSNTLEERVKSRFVQEGTFPGIVIESPADNSTIPVSFFNDFQRESGKAFLNIRPELENISDLARRFSVLSGEMKATLLEYNSTPLRDIFPMSKQKPATRTHLTRQEVENPIIKVSEYIQFKFDDKSLYPEQSDRWGAEDAGLRESNILQSYGIDPAILETLDEDAISVMTPERLGLKRPAIPQLNSFQRARQDSRIHEYTTLRGTSDLKRLAHRISFLLVYILLIGKLPKGELLICPKCGATSMKYYALPKPQYKHANLGKCFKNRGGCDASINIINLLHIKLDYKPQQAFKWLLANFDPWLWGVDTDFQLSTQDMEKFALKLDNQGSFNVELDHGAQNSSKRYGRTGVLG